MKRLHSLRKRMASAVVVLLAICSGTQAADSDQFAAAIEQGIVQYLADTRNFTLSTVGVAEPLGTAFRVPAVAKAEGLEGLLNAGQDVELTVALQSQSVATSFELDQQYQIRWNYGHFIAKDMKNLLAANGISQSEVAKALSNGEIVFSVYREKLQQPLHTLGVGIMRDAGNYVVAATQNLMVGELQYNATKAAELDQLLGTEGVMSALAKRLSSQQYTLGDKTVNVSDTAAVKLALGRIMETAPLAHN